MLARDALMRYSAGNIPYVRPECKAVLLKMDGTQSAVIGPCPPEKFGGILGLGNRFIVNGRLLTFTGIESGETIGFTQSTEETGWSSLNVCNGTYRSGPSYLRTIPNIVGISQESYSSSVMSFYTLDRNGVVSYATFDPGQLTLVEHRSIGPGWSEVVSAYVGPLDNAFFVYGIHDGYLYRLHSGAAEQLSSQSGWRGLTASASSNSTSGRGAYALCGSDLYHLAGSTLIRVGSESGWSTVTGYSCYTGTVSNDETYTVKEYEMAYGLRNGMLYKIDGTTPTLVDGNSDWTYLWGTGYRREKVYASGADTEYSTSTLALGIRSGVLYAIANETVTEIATAGECLAGVLVKLTYYDVRGIVALKNQEE